MNKTDDKILYYLSDIKGNGSFCSYQTADFVFPNLEIDGIGELSYPINEKLVTELKSKAHKAPFGIPFLT